MSSVGQPLISHGVGLFITPAYVMNNGRLGRVSFYLACKDNKIEGDGKEGSRLK